MLSLKRSWDPTSYLPERSLNWPRFKVGVCHAYPGKSSFTKEGF